MELVGPAPLPDIQGSATLASASRLREAIAAGLFGSANRPARVRLSTSAKAPSDLTARIGLPCWLREGIQVSLITFGVGALFTPGAYSWPPHYAVGLAVASRVACAAW